MKKKLLTILLSILMVATTLTVNVFAETVGGLITVNNIKYNITSLEPNMVEVGDNQGYLYITVEIPETITYSDKTYTVTKISESAFYDVGGIESVSIPNTVSIIGNSAFESCDKLTSVTLQEGLTTIGNRAFNLCKKLTSIVIPSTVTSIGDLAFNGCIALKTITCNATTPPSLGTSAFDQCTALEKIEVPATSVETYKTSWSSYKDKIVAIQSQDKTIEDILPNNFPQMQNATTPSNVWRNVGNTKTIYKSSDGEKIVFTGSVNNVLLSNVVSKDSNNYVYTNSDPSYTITFVMSAGDNPYLSSIVVAGHSTESYNDTFYPSYKISGTLVNANTKVAIMSNEAISITGGDDYSGNPISSNGAFSTDSMLHAGEYTITAAANSDNYYASTKTVTLTSGDLSDVVIELIPKAGMQVDGGTYGTVTIAENEYNVPVGSSYSVDGDTISFEYENGDTTITRTLKAKVKDNYAEEYEFDKWTIGGVDVPSSGTVTGNMSICAKFRKAAIIIGGKDGFTYDYTGPFAYVSGDAITYSREDNVLTLSFSGKQYSITATAKDGYKFDYWTAKVNGSDYGLYDQGTIPSTAFGFDSPITFEPSYSRLGSFTLNLKDEEGDAITGAEVTLTENKDYTYTATETDSGTYVIKNVVPFNYNYIVRKENFETYHKSDVFIIYDVPYSENVTLKAGKTITIKDANELGDLNFGYPDPIITCEIRDNNNTVFHSGDYLAIGETYSVKPGMNFMAGFMGYQLDYFVIFDKDGQLPDTYSFNSGKLEFTMPDSPITVNIYGSHAISSVNINWTIPAVDDTSITNPEIATTENYTLLTDVNLLDENGENVIVNATHPIEEGKTYYAEISLKAKDGYSFKYKDSVEFEDGDANEFNYGATVKVNNETVANYANDSEITTKTGYMGAESVKHDSLTIYYQLTYDKSQNYENTPFEINEDFTGTLEFITDADYSEDSDVTVKIDDTIIDASNYDLSHGSTHITLHNDFIRTLSVGTHEVTICVKGYNDVAQSLVIKAVSEDPSPSPTPGYKVPNTGVEGTYSNNHSLLKLSSLSLLAIGTYMAIKKKKDN